MATRSSSVYQLSSEILGHTGDIRAVCAFEVEGEPDEYIVTASRDKTACVWVRYAGTRDFLLHKQLTSHSGYVSSICIVPTDSKAGGVDKTLVATGSQDNTVLLHSLDLSIQEPLQCYTGHNGLVTCIIYQHSQLISASWDSTVRIWSSNSESKVLQAHEPAVWTLSGLAKFDGSKRILSGGADKIIRLWETDTLLCIQEYRGHKDVVRDVKVISPEVFLSASNDCTICRWNIHTGLCLNQLVGHEAFIYSIAPLSNSSDEFASCGEDGTLRIWKDTECVQTIRLPCVSVWSVYWSSNGDIVVGSSDSTARVFTTNALRTASEEHIKNFLSRVEEYQLSKSKQSIDVESLPKISVALSEPGQKTGDTKLVNNNGKAEVYQWDADINQWLKTGDALSRVPKIDNIYDGNEYDYLFDIEIDDGGPVMRKLKLPYNKIDDPYVAAEEFLTVNDLPMWYLDQVADFILQNADVQHVSTGIADPFTGGARYIPGESTRTSHLGEGQDPLTGGSRYKPSDSGAPSVNAMDPFTGASAYRSSETITATHSNSYFPITSYQTFTSSSDYIGKIIMKLREFSQVSDKCCINEDEIRSIESLCLALTTSGTPTSDQLQLLHKLLDWPVDYIFPILDVLRLAVLHNTCYEYFAAAPVQLIDRLEQLGCAPDAQSKNQLLVLRVLVNVFSLGEAWIQAHQEQIFGILDKLLLHSSKTHQISLATVLMNYSYCCNKYSDNNCVSNLIDFAMKILRSSEHNLEAKFRVMIAIGTLTSAKKDVVLSTISSGQLTEVIAPLCDINEPTKVSECALTLLESFI